MEFHTIIGQEMLAWRSLAFDDFGLLDARVRDRVARYRATQGLVKIIIWTSGFVVHDSLLVRGTAGIWWISRFTRKVVVFKSVVHF